MDVNATADAILLIDKLRVEHCGDMPHAVWAILAHASSHLSGQLRAYLIPTEQLSDECPQCSRIGNGSLCKAHRSAA